MCQGWKLNVTQRDVLYKKKIVLASQARSINQYRNLRNVTQRHVL